MASADCYGTDGAGESRLPKREYMRRRRGLYAERGRRPPNRQNRRPDRRVGAGGQGAGRHVSDFGQEVIEGLEFDTDEEWREACYRAQRRSPSYGSRSASRRRRRPRGPGRRAARSAVSRHQRPASSSGTSGPPSASRATPRSPRRSPDTPLRVGPAALVRGPVSGLRASPGLPSAKLATNSRSQTAAAQRFPRGNYRRTFCLQNRGSRFMTLGEGCHSRPAPQTFGTAAAGSSGGAVMAPPDAEYSLAYRAVT